MISLVQNDRDLILLVEVPDQGISPIGAAARVPYVARITGRHPTFKYDRVFLGRRGIGPNGEARQLVDAQRELAVPVDLLIIRDEAGTNAFKWTAALTRLERVSFFVVEEWVKRLEQGRTVQDFITVEPGRGSQDLSPVIVPTPDAHRRIRLDGTEGV